MTKREQFALFLGTLAVMFTVFVLPRLVGRATAQTAVPTWEAAIYRIDTNVADMRARMDAACVSLGDGSVACGAVVPLAPAP